MSRVMPGTGRTAPAAAARRAATAIGMALLLFVCVAGAASTARLWLQVGLGPRGPMSVLGTVVRFAGVALALVLWPFRRDLLERGLLACVVLGGGASGLYGFGVTSPLFALVRLLFHLVGFLLGAVVILRWAAVRATTAEEAK